MNVMTKGHHPNCAPHFLAEAFNSLPDAVLVFDGEDRLVHWNSRLSELLPDGDLVGGETLAAVTARLDGLSGAPMKRVLHRGDGRLWTLTLRPAEEAHRGALRATVGGGRIGDCGSYLQNAIEHLSHGLALFDADDRLVLCNTAYRNSFPALAEMMKPGARFVDLVRTLAQSLHDTEDEVAEAVEARVRQHRRGSSHERRDPDGRWHLIKDIRTSDGWTLVTRVEISDLKRRELAVRESEARFRAIFQYAAMGVAVIHPGGEIAEVNQALESMLGYGTGELTGLNYARLVHPEDLAREKVLARKLVANELDRYQLEARYIRKNGSVFWARLTVSVVRGAFGIAMIEDIDEKKRAEADLSTFRAVVEASAEAIVILSADGQPFYVNSAHEKLFGRGLSDALKMDYLGHYTADSQEIIRGEVSPRLHRGESWEGILDGRTVDGRVFRLWQRAGVVTGPSNQPQYYFAFMHDHTSQQQIQDELYKAKEAAEQANIAKTRFLAAASHDLRQPLQALSMFVAVLSSRRHSPEDTALISRIEDSVQAVETLLNGLLDVSKLEAGLVVPVMSAFNVGPLLSRLAAEFEPLVEAAGLELRLVPSRAMIKSDPALLERIVRNLLNNAVRYTQKGRIVLGCRRHGGNLRVEVWDSGIGIPQSQLKLIFREFHQLGNPGRDRRQGLGLGLAIVERLAQLMGHGIDVSSVPQRGSMFAIEVPLAVQPENVAQPRQLTLGMGRKDASIVVIEDEPDVLESTRLLLESWGYHVIPAIDCDEALRRLPNLGKVPDLILADYRLQNGATGGQAITRIRSRVKAAVPAIILTGDTAPERLKQAQASGHGLLHKPVQPAALRDRIEELLTRAPAAC